MHTEIYFSKRELQLSRSVTNTFGSKTTQFSLKKMTIQSQ